MVSTGKRKRLVVILGAGASIGFGVPSTKELTEEVKRRAKCGCDPKGAAWNANFACARELFLSTLHLKDGATIEDVGTRLTDMQGANSGSYSNNSVSRLIDDCILWLVSTVYEIFSEEAERAKKISCTQGLDDQTDEDVRGTSPRRNGRARYVRKFGPATKYASICQWQRLVSLLGTRYQVGFLSLNFEPIARESYLRFSPDERVNLRVGTEKENGAVVLTHSGIQAAIRRWNFFFQLHGSIRFVREPRLDGSSQERWSYSDCATLNPVRTYIQSNGKESNGGKRVYPLLVGGSMKKLIPSGFLNLYWQNLRSLLVKADAVLIIGYSFGDEELNRKLRAVFGRYPSQGRRKVPIVIVDPGEGVAARAACELGVSAGRIRLIGKGLDARKHSYLPGKILARLRVHRHPARGLFEIAAHCLEVVS